MCSRGYAATLTIVALCCWGVAEAGQMTSPKRAPRAVKPVETDLPPIHVDFVDLAEKAGVTAENVSGDEEQKRFILEATGNGVAIFDYDNDGLMDVFVVSGTTLDGDGKGKASTSRLYRNLGGLRFEDVTEKAGLRHVGWGQGVCVGDFDNDGHRDLFVTYYGQSILHRNQGDGTFEDVTEAAGLAPGGVRWHTGCSFFDYDLDGLLDLVVTGYLEFDRRRVPEPGSDDRCQWKGIPVMCGPRGLPFTTNMLFRNEGNGVFKDVSAESGIGRARGCYGFSVVASDFDNDHYPDLYAACDSTPSLLYRNRRDGTFEEIGLLAGVALNEDGQAQSGMGVAVADYDEDGHTDIVKTNFSDDLPNMYRNNGALMFDDLVYQAGLGAHTEYVGWGVLFLDLDHDGRKDLLIVNGHVYPEVTARGDEQFRQPRQVYWNVGDGRFKEISATAGAAIAEAWSSRGAAAGDLDNDGSLEVVVNNMGDRPSLLKNVGLQKHWLLVQLVGTRSNRDAVGARAFVSVAGRRLSGEVQTGTSYLSQNDPRLHFGLADETGYNRIEVQWPGGAREVFPGGPANRIVLLTEGTGSPAGH